MKKICFKSTGSLLLLIMSVMTCWLTWGVELLSGIGGCLIFALSLSGSILLWKDASSTRKGEKDG